MSQLSISNIAWATQQDESVADLLGELEVHHIDLAPTKYFADISEATEADWKALKRFWNARDIEIAGFQSLLFGAQGVNLFTTDEERANTLQRLQLVADIANHLGATKLVFGSPKNRDRGNLSDSQVESISSDFFWNLGEIGVSRSVEFCLEPNPPAYGSNFMTASAETAQVVNRVNHPNVKMQFDTGAVEMNKESPILVTQNFSNIVGHVHLSAAFLEPAYLTQLKPDSLAVALANLSKIPFVTIEQKEVGALDNMESIAKSIRFARQMGIKG